MTETSLRYGTSLPLAGTSSLFRDRRTGHRVSLSSTVPPGGISRWPAEREDLVVFDRNVPSIRDASPVPEREDRRPTRGPL
ncbi:hypothetical protein JXQ31_16765 [candidate division KSB1 bacterium]|nr:hypothetical protein [candidate division KSB1 bacterium]